VKCSGVLASHTTRSGYVDSTNHPSALRLLPGPADRKLGAARIPHLTNLSARCGEELYVSLQIAILKVLASHPEGRATIAALNSDLSILNTGGSDWTDRLRRLAARAPGLDIFGQRLILRDSSGWQITPEGRAFLDWLERGAASAHVPLTEPSPPPPQQPPLLLVGVTRWQRLTRRGRFADPRRRSA
jgi:hypothetical protein